MGTGSGCTIKTLSERLKAARDTFGGWTLAELEGAADEIARWRAGLTETSRYRLTLALRQVLGAAVRWPLIILRGAPAELVTFGYEGPTASAWQASRACQARNACRRIGQPPVRSAIRELDRGDFHPPRMMRLVLAGVTLSMMRRRIRGRPTRSEGGEGQGSTRDEYLEIDPGELTNVFAVPNWLRGLGLTAWLLVGVALFLVGVIWLLSLTETIVMPVIAASVVAAVTAPLVAVMNRHGVPRRLGAVLVLLGTVALGIGLFLIIVTGITSETGSIKGELADAKDTLAGWLEDAGVDPSAAENAKDEASNSVSESVSHLLEGIGEGISALSGLAFFLALTALSLFFLLGDGPKIRAWVEGHMGVPPDVGHVIGERTLGALRGYFLGVTIVAGFNAVVITTAALIIGVPLAGTIAVVTFLGAYIPYLGAWAAGAFVVLLTLGSSGADAAAAMIVVQLLANGALQQMVQPFAMGAALGIHPLAVLVVTVAGGALFGTAGLILAAPLTSAVVRISDDLARARAGERSAEAAAPG